MPIEEDLFGLVEEFSNEDISDETKPPKKKEQEEQEEEQVEDLFFSDSSEVITKEEKEPSSVLSILKEKGLISYEDEDIVDLEDEDTFIEEKLEELVENRFKESLDEVPEENKEIVSYLLKGGDLNTLLSTVGREKDLPLDLDLSEERNQERALKHLLLEEGDDDEETVESYIEHLKETGKLKLVSEKKFNKWKTDVEEERKEVLAQAESKKIKEKEAIKKAKEENAEFLKDKKELGILPITPEDKKVLPSYMTEKTVAIQNGQKITPFYSDLFYKVMANKTSAAQLAILVKNADKEGNLNFKRLENTIRTKGTNEIKDELERAKQTNRPTKSNKTLDGSAKKSIAHYIN